MKMNINFKTGVFYLLILVAGILSAQEAAKPTYNPTIDDIRNKPDYYQTLGINSDATSEDITKAWRKLLLVNHPDKIKTVLQKQKDEGTITDMQYTQRLADADAQTKLINEAKEILTDPRNRATYDRIKAAAAGMPQSEPAAARPATYYASDRTVNSLTPAEKTAAVERKGNTITININGKGLNNLDGIETLVASTDYAKITFIDARNNQLVKVGDVFLNFIARLPNLTQVFLGHNKITLIPQDLITKAPQVTVWGFSNNRIAFIPDNLLPYKTKTPGKIWINVANNPLDLQ